MKLLWKEEINSPSKPGGCFVVNEPGKRVKVFYNINGSQGTGCNSNQQCVCEEPYGSEVITCSNPLSISQCEKAADALKLKWQENLIFSDDKPRGCFIDKSGCAPGKVVFNTKGNKGEECEDDLPCVCNA